MKHASRIALLAMATIIPLTGCASEQPKRIGFEEARAMFAARGVQPGQPLPALALVNLEGTPASLPALQAKRPLVLVTASLTCNVARRQQTQVDELRQRFGNAVAVVVVYTIDAHPAGDPCPYTGEEWVPEDNRKDQVLIHQPKTLAERLDAARTFQKRFSTNATVLVDMMDDAAWKALGSAPNLGLLVGSDGIVRLRQGWFDAEAMTKELISIGLTPAAR